MKSYLKHGVSAIALLSAFSLAQAQERQGKEGGAAPEHMQGEQGGGAMKSGGAAQRQGGMEKGKTAERGPANRSERSTVQNRASQAEQNRTGTEAKSHRTAKNAPTEEQKDQSRQRQGEQNLNANEHRQRESNAGAAGKSETLGREGAGTSKHAALHVSNEQKTKLHDAVIHDTAIHRYNQSDIHFNVALGTRIPENIEFYAPPPQFVELIPDFRYYRIVMVGDEIIVVDPATREIVDIIYV